MSVPPRSAARLANLNLFGTDLARLCGFYAGLFGFAEITARRTTIYRVLDAGGVELGFNAAAVRGLLGFADRQSQGRAPVTAYPTFDVAHADDVNALAQRAVALGGTLVKQAYRTHYGTWQVVLADPEENIFRIQCHTPHAA